MEIDGCRDTVIVLTGIKYAANPPLADLTADLLTRVQGSNVWKAAKFPTAQNPERKKNLPKNIRLALKEFDRLIF